MSISGHVGKAWCGMVLAGAAAGAAEIDLSKLPAAVTRTVDFAKDVHPIFAQSCYGCHGPKRQEAALRFDVKAEALKGSENGPVIVPGKSAESRIIHAVSWAGDLKMPKKGDRLTEEQVGVLRAWIDQGAQWPETAVAKQDGKDHWAFKAPVRPALPEPKLKGWAQTPVDNFILVRLEKEGLKPSPEADKVTWLRRLSLDLIGLPPTIQEVDAFLADQSPDAYQKQVERLLRSPHYGERWGRHWLDAARYADSDGFEKDKSRSVWFYRDWVVKAFNEDKPYDQFVIAQLAGDQLPKPTQDDVVATGFLRNSMLNEEGAIDPEQFRMEAMFDRMDAIGKGVLGLTIQCGQCHNHKYDPLKQEEYYKMFAFVNNDHEATTVAYTSDELMKVESLSRRMREIEEGLKHRTADWESRMAKWEEEVKDNQPEWVELTPEEFGDPGGGAKYRLLKDNSIICEGYAPTKLTTRFVATTNLTDISAVRLEVLTDPNLPRNGPGRSYKGTFGLTEFKLEVAKADSPTNRVKATFSKATADYEMAETPLEPNFYDKSTNNRVVGPIKFSIDGEDNTAWDIDAGPGRRNQDRKAVFQLATNVGFPEGTVLRFSIVQNHGGWNSDDHMNNLIGRLRISVATAEGEVKADPIPKKVRDILAMPREQRSAAQQNVVFSYWRRTVPEWREANDEIEGLWKQWPNGTTQLALKSRAEPRDTRVLRRGDWLKPAARVKAGVPAFLHPSPEGADGSRLTFAKWLVDRRSPTTARVFVNRIWQAYFGTGLVSTPEDFGLQSEKPSHPELLDWLACEFMDRGWSTKAIHRLIVNSATYKQSSRVTPELYEKDPQNRLLARGPRFRVEGEIVRDISLAASGLLNPKVGGPSIFTPIPYKLEPPLSYAPFPWNEETGPDRYRRGLYTFRRRSTPHPVLQNFDSPNGDFSCVRRVRSNTPLQALTTLNEVLFVEAAQALALKTLEDGGRTDQERIGYAFRRCTSRKPSQDETQELVGLLERQKQRFADGWAEPRPVALRNSSERPKLPEGTNPTQLAAYTMVARVLLNLDETITKE
ncbi:MAG: PSD1 and planctomycete cytochrome C domain-containing protein [Verrucomicrobia subdivision 3 bacterium]|nr:PSD1 and planctomycete cytochrome C domain-containing protein [Limisphaerales bacterium]